MAATKTASDIAKMLGKRALDGVIVGDESTISHALKSMSPEELKTLAVDAIILQQYVRDQLIAIGAVPDPEALEADLSAIAASHPLR